MRKPNPVIVKKVDCFNNLSDDAFEKSFLKIESDLFTINVSTVLGLVRKTVVVEQDWLVKNNTVIKRNSLFFTG